jgi:flagellin FlaB
MAILSDLKAQVGVGSMILFIAMLLVAAVGASTLIQTTGKFQQQAAVSGGQGVREVSTKVALRSIVGYSSNPSEGRFDKLILTVSLGSGDELPLDNLVMTYQAGDIYIPRIYYNASAGDANGAPDFYVRALIGDEDNVLTKNELLELHFWIEYGTPFPLNASTEFTISLTPRGATGTVFRGTTPMIIVNPYTFL